MRKFLLLAGLSTVLAASAAAQDLSLDQYNLFISPCGQPFIAPKTEPYPIVKWFNGADANHDGKLDMEEMRNDAGRFFQVLDRNHDGYIDGPEVQYYEYRIVPEILNQRGGSLQSGILKASLQTPGDIAPVSPVAPGSEGIDKPRLNFNQGATYFSLFREPEPVRSADRNFDYKVSLQEFLAHSDRHFKALDFDNLGYLTLAKLPRTDAERENKARR